MARQLGPAMWNMACTPNTGTRATCTNNPGVLVGTYVNVAVTYQFNTLFHYPGLPDSTTLTSGQGPAFRLN